MMLATSIATRQKAEASVADVPTVPVVDTSESVRYKVFLSNFPRLVETVRPVVVKFAVNALSKSLISDYNKCQAENATKEEYDRASVLMSQILPKIKDSDAHFDAFVAILQELKMTKLACELKKAVDPRAKLPVTASGTKGDSDSGSTSGAESVEATGFQCPCGNCSITSYLKDRSKCPGHQEGTFPHLDLDHLGKDEKEALRRQLVRDTDKIMEKFDDFSDGVFEALERNQTPVEKIVNTIITSGQRVPRPIQDTPHGDELKTISTITGLHTFLVRHKYISFINYRILEKVISKHCKECQADLDEYVEKFKIFGKRNVFEVPPNVINSSASGPVLVVKVINEMWFGVQQGTQDNHLFSVNDVCAIRNKIAEVIETDIHLIDISDGCIQLAFEVLSCQEAPIFPLSTSQLSELIRCGIIVLYQPNVPSLPTNIQDTDGQTHDIQSTDTDDSETPPTIPSADDSETTPTIPSADDSETPPIPSLFTTPPVQILSSIKPPVTRIFHSKFTDDDRSMASVDLGYSGSRASSLGYSGSRASSLGYSGSRASSLGYSGSRASSLVVLQEPRKWIMSTELSLTMEPLEERIARKKWDIEHWKHDKALYQQRQRKAEERVRGLQSRLAQTTDEDDQRELERKIHDEEKMIKVWKEEVQQCEKLIKEAEPELLTLTDKEQSQLQTLSRKKELSLTMEELKRTIADKKRDIEDFKEYKTLHQQKQREAEEEVRLLQSRLAQTTDEDDWRELERKIHDEEEWIKWCKERVQRWEERINKAEADLLTLTETKDKATESKILLDLGITFPSLQTDTSRLKSSQELPLRHVTKPSRRPMTSPSYQPVTVAAVMPTVPSSEQSQHQTLSGKKELPLTIEELEIRIAEKKRWIEYYKEDKAGWQQSQRKAEEEVRVLQSRLAQTTDEDDQRELERKIHHREEEIKWCEEGMQQYEEWINEAEADLHVLSLKETKDKATESKRLLDEGRTKASPSLQTDTSRLKPSQELPLRHGTKPSRRPMTLPFYQPVTVAAVKPTVPSSEQSQHQTLSGKEELPPAMKPLEKRIADKKRDIEIDKRFKADHQRWQREAEEEVRVLQSRLAQTTDEDDRRVLERKIHDGEEKIKRRKKTVQYWEEWINTHEADLLALTETKDKATDPKRLLDLGMTSPSLQTDTSRLKSSQELPLRHVTKPSRRRMTPPSYQPVTAAAVKPTVPSSEQSQLQTLSGKKELSLTMEELEERIAEKKREIEAWKYNKAGWQQSQRKAEEEVRDLQSRLAQTTDEYDQSELERKIHDAEMEIKVCKERLQQCEEWINEAESELLALKKTKNKATESKRLLDLERTMMSPSLQTDTSCLKTIQELLFIHATEPSIEPMTPPSYQPVTAAVVKPSSEQSQLQTLSGKKELSLTIQELKRRIAGKKSDIEFYKYMKADYQQWQREAEEEERRLQDEFSQTTNLREWMQLENKIQENKKIIKMWKADVQRCEVLIDHNETELQSLEERLDKEFNNMKPYPKQNVRTLTGRIFSLPSQPVAAASVSWPTVHVPSSEFNQSNFNLELVCKALTDFLDWHKLGLMLGLKNIKLDQIRVDFDKYGLKRRRDEMVRLWLDSDGDASWEKLCTALENMDQNTIADEIRRRYSVRRK